MKKIKLLITSAALLVGGGLLASSSNNIMKANAAEGEKTVVYSIVDRNELTASGDIIEGANATLNNTYNGNFDQITKGNSMTFNLSNIPESYVITNITLKTHTNSSKGAGNITISVGDVVEYDNVRYSKPNSTTYVDYSFDINNLSGDVSVILKCTTNSLYCNTFSITYRSQEKYNINFYDGESLLGSQTVEGGNLIDFSSVSYEKEGYVLIGWYTDFELTMPFDNDTSISDNLNLYAKFVLIEDLTPGQIFQLETTKTSMVAYAGIGEVKSSINLDNIVQTQTLKATDNDASILGLDNTIWNIDSEKNDNNNYPVVNKDGYLRIYYPKTTEKPSVTFKLLENSISSISVTSTGGKLSVESSLNGVVFDNVDISEDGKYYFPEGTTSFKLINSTTQYIESGLKDNLDVTGLNISYSGFGVSAASLRFGATLDSKIYDETAKYGVVFGLAGEDLNTLAEGKTTIDELALPYQEVDHGTIAKVDEEGALEESETPETAQFFQYAIVVNNMLAHIDEEITAACYMQTTDGLYVMNEVTYSLRSLAQKYIDDHVVDESIDVLNAIVGYQA